MLHGEGAAALQQLLALQTKVIHVHRDPREMLYYWAREEAPMKTTGMAHLIRKNVR